MMRTFLKWCWRLYKSIVHRKRYVHVSTKVLFNPQTIFHGFNRVWNGSVVSGSEVGRFSYIGANSYLPNARIGRFCSIGNQVKVIAETHPVNEFVSTSPVFFSTHCQCGVSFVKEDLVEERKFINGHTVEIGNDVWIGDNCLILGGGTNWRRGRDCDGCSGNQGCSSLCYRGWCPSQGNKIPVFRVSDRSTAE